MDLYVPGQDSMPFSMQEMMDYDMKSEIEHVLASSDLTLGDLGMEHALPPFDLDGLDPLDGSGLDSAVDSDSDLGLWLNSVGGSSGGSGSHNHSFMDFEPGSGGLMVDPTHIMPVSAVQTSVPSSSAGTTATVSAPAASRGEVVTLLTTNREVAFSPATLTLVNVGGSPRSVTTRPVTLKTIPAQTTFRQAVQQQRKVVKAGVSVAEVQVGSGAIGSSAVETGAAKEMAMEPRAFPKPAYSYSCLIAMALKNSKAGSLPVSEIYSFMCEHFPYFKTAPNGWKNSVRHNLSLNKCFEKIEKPSGNGSQRKGCLWAMNPAKVSKMDEEVQKWSRKDPLAIKKAMAYPENLDMLERGELKREVNLNVSCDESEDEDLDLAPTTPSTPTSQRTPPHPPTPSTPTPPAVDQTFIKTEPSEFISLDQFGAMREAGALSDLHMHVDDSTYEVVTNGVYEELGEDRLDLGVNITSDITTLPVTLSASGMVEFATLPTSTIQGNYLYTTASIVENNNQRSSSVGAKAVKASSLVKTTRQQQHVTKVEGI